MSDSQRSNPVSISARLRAGELMYRALRELIDDSAKSFPEKVNMTWTVDGHKTFMFTYAIPQPPQVVTPASPPPRAVSPAALAAAARLDAVPFDALNAFIDGEMAQAVATQSGRHTPPSLAKTPRPASSKKRAVEQISRAENEDSATGEETEEIE